MNDTSYILIHNRAGSIVAWTLIDDADYPELSRYRWSISTKGQVFRNAPEIKRGAKISMQRQLLGLEAGDRTMVNYVNHNRLDNRRENLQTGTQTEVNQNRAPIEGASSRYRGVSWHKAAQAWEAKVTANGTTYHLGYFDDEDEAGAVTATARAEHMALAAD